MMRLFRITDLIHKYRKMHQSTKIIINIAKLVLFLTIFLHWIACLWYISVRISSPTIVKIEGNSSDLELGIS